MTLRKTKDLKVTAALLLKRIPWDESSIAFYIMGFLAVACVIALAATGNLPTIPTP